MEQVKYNEYWIVKKLGPRTYIASATSQNDICLGERRMYFSRSALEDDFPGVSFEDEKEKVVTV